MLMGREIEKGTESEQTLAFELPPIDDELLNATGKAGWSARRIGGWLALLLFIGIAASFLHPILTLGDKKHLFLIIPLLLFIFLFYKLIDYPRELEITDEGMCFNYSEVGHEKVALSFDWKDVLSTQVPLVFITKLASKGPRAMRAKTFIYVALRVQISSLRYQRILIPTSLFKEFSNQDELTRAFILNLALHQHGIKFASNVFFHLEQEMDLGLGSLVSKLISSDGDEISSPVALANQKQPLSADQWIAYCNNSPTDL